MLSMRMAVVCLGVLFGVASLSAQPVSLVFKPLDVQYSQSLDRLVMISANPNRVHLVNPVSGAATTINLSLAPLSLSVSPDGTHAAVGHDGWISYVNLSGGYVEKNLAVSATASTVILAGNGSIWAPPSTINIATGVQTPSAHHPWGGGVKPALHPNGKWIYYTHGYSPDDVIKGDISSGTFQYLYDSKYHGDFPVCAGIFYSADGNRLLTGCGTLFRTTASSDDDISYNGALSAAQFVTAASDSTIARKLAVIPGTRYSSTSLDDTEIQFYDNEYLMLLGRVALPKLTVGTVTAPWRGRFIFYSPDASKLYLVVQADAQAKLENDFAIYNLTLSTGSNCGATVATNSTNLPASGGSVDVSVSATDGCLWQSSSNANWLSLHAGGVATGNAKVTIRAAPNLQTISRTGTVTIAGLNYTVTQNAAAAPGVDPITLSPVRPIAVEYSAALDRMILVSTNPDLLTIFDPLTGGGQTVPLVMPPTALSISPDGMRAAVGHDGRISYINLGTASVEKTFPVTTVVYSLALSARDIYAFPLRDQWQAVRIVNIASGTETLWNQIYAGTTTGKISPNGKYLYINATKRYDITQPLPSAFDVILGYFPHQWFSQDGSRLYSGSGQAFRLSDAPSQDLQYSGTLESEGLTAVADSSVQQVTATVARGSLSDTRIKFFGQQYLSAIGSISIPKFTSGTNSYDAHGRHLFWNAAGNRLFAVVQADQTSGLLNDYAIYSVSFNGGCNTSISGSTENVPAAGGNFSASVTANAGCAWKATSSAPWLTISANAFSAGPATLKYIVDPNTTTSVRTTTIAVEGKTITVTQAAGTQVQPSAVTTLPFRVIDAEYTNALDRIVAISSNPSRLNIYDPANAVNIPVTLPLAGNAVSIAPSGVRAAVCHDGLVSVVNLQTATIEKLLNVSVNCHDIVFAENGYVYMSVAGGWGSSISVNITTGFETKSDLLYSGTNFQLNATGDAVYTSNTGTSAASVSRYTIAGGPMMKDYESEWYPANPFGYRIWFTRDGRMAADSGSVFRTGSTKTTDFIYSGTLSGLTSYVGAIVSLAHSTTRRLFASIGPSSNPSGPSDRDVTLFLHGDRYLALSSKMKLPKITTGGVSADGHGKFVFWDSTGTKAYVIMQADASAGFLNDFAIYTLSPKITPGCTVTLGTNSGTAIGQGDTGSVAVNAASDCVWEVKSNAPWIQIDSGTLGVGIGNLAYSVLANDAGGTRSGTITIGGQTFTVTQSGGSGQNQPPVISSLSPFAGSGPKTFTLTFSDPNGWADLAHAYILINHQVWTNSSCYVDFDVAGNTISLMNDAGNSWLPAIPISTASTASNSQCSVNAALSSVSGSGNTLTLNLALTFGPTYTGKHTIFLKAADRTGAVADWLAFGVWYPNSVSASLIRRYRLFSHITHSHLYTTDLNEYNVLGTLGWVQEGADAAVYNAPITLNNVDAVAFWRIYKAQSQSHFWTTDRNEYTTLISNYRGIYIGEGADAFILPAQIPNSIPLYRMLWNGPGPPLHHWSTDANEYDTLTRIWGSWKSEGIPGYVFPPAMAAPQNRKSTAHVSAGRTLSISSVVDAVTYESDRAAPGQLISVLGSFPDGAAVQVMIGEIAVAGVRVSDEEMRVVIPEGLPAGSSVPVVVWSGGQASNAIAVQLVDSNPRILASDPFGRGQAQATNEDGTANSEENPAPAGSILTLQITGVRDERVTATIGGRPAPVVAQPRGSRPGTAVLQLKVPEGVPGGTVPVRLKAGEAFSQSGVTLVVK